MKSGRQRIMLVLVVLILVAVVVVGYLVGRRDTREKTTYTNRGGSGGAGVVKQFEAAGGVEKTSGGQIIQGCGAFLHTNPPSKMGDGAGARQVSSIYGAEVVNVYWDEVEYKGRKYDRMTLEIGLGVEGEQKSLIVAVVDKIDTGIKNYTAEGESTSSQDLGLMAVRGIDIQAGDRADITFFQVAEGDIGRVIQEMCERTANAGCNMAAEAGFGRYPIDFAGYIDEVLAGDGRMENRYLLPVKLVVGRGQS